MSSFAKTSLPKKVPLTGSDCFHLVLDMHAKNYNAGSNVMRIAFYLNNTLTLYKTKKVFDNSPLIHWLCNVRLRQGRLFTIPFWQYKDRGNSMQLNEYRHPFVNEIPALVLQKDIPLDGERFVEGDIIHYPGNKSIFILSWNHIIMDGRGIGMLVQHLNDVANGNVDHSIEHFFPAREKMTGLLSHIRNMYKVKAFIEKSSKAPISSIAGKKNLSTTSFNNSILHFTVSETKTIHDNAIQNGAKFGANLFYLSCCANAVHAIHKQRKKEGVMWIPVPYDGRLRGSLGPIISNTVAFLFYRIPQQALVSTAQTVTSLYNQMTEQMKDRMPQQYGMLLNMMRHIPLRLYYFLVNKRGEGSFASFLYSSTGENFNAIKSLFGESVQDLTIFPSPTFPPGLTFSFLKHQDALNINIAYTPDVVNNFELSTIELTLKNLLLGKS